jgi:hypothetical protein
MTSELDVVLSITLTIQDSVSTDGVFVDSHRTAYGHGVGLMINGKGGAVAPGGCHEAGRPVRRAALRPPYPTPYRADAI